MTIRTWRLRARTGSPLCPARKSYHAYHACLSTLDFAARIGFCANSSSPRWAGSGCPPALVAGCVTRASRRAARGRERQGVEHRAQARAQGNRVQARMELGLSAFVSYFT